MTANQTDRTRINTDVCIQTKSTKIKFLHIIECIVNLCRFRVFWGDTLYILRCLNYNCEVVQAAQRTIGRPSRCCIFGND
jgi:hypothetical protein